MTSTDEEWERLLRGDQPFTQSNEDDGDDPSATRLSMVTAWSLLVIVVGVAFGIIVTYILALIYFFTWFADLILVVTENSFY
ncbi:hypothetical protein FDJ44_gp29 [Microbacterium phage Pikmin]|uniref:Uncharacterized protein n=3 Tax=Pikminvirus pikmin TaxID=2560596 RepID=A0A2P1CL59_9CAUD|nr:hypothetical protein FDJ44_gp29 [Microbacterium phage Pikmin]AVJ51020.1 hypothetical protein PBI_PAJAZA_29 [Microbacterium phage Pajaza]AVJ51167.1 hypothetical protein PBI_PIKMIN_29 [Microbacterium phage Pikmin]AVJ51725.1 hypothetical protein PBI_CASEY_29 [Microbacterium phage Casey]